MAVENVPFLGLIIRAAIFVWKYFLAWLKLPFTLKNIEEKLQPAAKSTNARYCPNCDARMKIGSVYGEGNWFKCDECNISQHYKTKH